MVWIGLDPAGLTSYDLCRKEGPLQEPEPLDPELERLAAWFVQNRRKIAVALDFDDLFSVDQGIFGVKNKVDKHGNVTEQVRLVVPPRENKT